MSELDDALRQSFARIAEPGDPAGVADALRARLAAGDTGTPAATSGFGAGRHWFWPFLALAVVLGLIGGALGASGAFTGGLPSAVEAPPVITETVDAPTATASPTPTPTATSVPAPTEVAAPPPVAPAADTSGPSLGGATATPDDEVCADDSYAAYYAVSSTISVVANDDVGVAGIHLSWTGADSGFGEMTPGANWTFAYNPSQNAQTGTVTFTLVARDAAGNTSAPATTAVGVIAPGSCLI